MNKIPEPKFISNFKNRIGTSFKTIEDLIMFVEQHDVVIFKYNDNFYKIQKENLQP